MFVHAGRLVRAALLALLLTAAAATPALSVSPATTRPAEVANAATAAPKAPSAGVAVIYRVSGAPYYRVHNALLLEERAGVGIKVAHVGVWPANTKKPPVQEFWVCKNPQSATCPTPKRSNWRLDSYRNYSAQPCPSSGGVTYCPGPFIAYRSSAGTHNGAFACWRPANSTTCSKTWPGDNRIYQSSGTLRVLHYANPNPPAHAPHNNRGSYANHPGDFKFLVHTVPGPVSAQRICYLRGTC
ncbi:hypothetical protein [Streptomyces bungoensis]|uniref:hypothetical protein n=1 Tax=Streptomyces bungoensis TaxID=285568 RepID=UPI00131E9A72|nr:hypothetical protein [Streptomyces bungoensis]